MRVQDSKPIGVTTMGRKKQRLRKPERQNSDTSDETTAADVQCGHLNKSVNLNVVRKALRIPNIVGKCQTCSVNNDSTQNRLAKNDAGSTGSADSPLSVTDESSVDCESHSICICLQCGHQGCDRYSAEKHALQHFLTTSQSVAHNLVLNLSSFQAWCYACDNHVPVDGSKKVLECVEYIYRLLGHKDSVASCAKRNDALRDNGPSNETSALELRDGASGTTKDERNRHKVTHIAPATSGVLIGYPKVKGLNNLGNTCFFNAVVQNLGQTHLLELQLREFSRKGHSIDLFACPLEMEVRSLMDDEAEDKDDLDEQDDQEIRKPGCLSLNLGDSGQLTQSMLSLFDEMKSSTGKQNAVSPSALFGQVCKKAPRFKGFQQQDSHELLRYLLDAIRGEEIKRSQTAILRAFKLPENPKAKDVSDELKLKVKAFGRQAKHTFVDSIFGGHLISTVICQACHTPFQVFEPFLDLSLPLSEEKPFKSTSFQGGKTKEEGKKGEVCIDKTETILSGANQHQPSKHLTKKERKLAKKKASKAPGRKRAPPAIVSEEKMVSGDADEAVVAANHVATAAEAGDTRDEEDVEKATEEETLQKNEGEDEEEEEENEDGADNSMEEDEEEVEEVRGEAKGDEDEKRLNYAEMREDLKLVEADGTCPQVNGVNERSAVEDGDMRGTSPIGSDESSDADVEDNVESDASRYQGMVNSMDMLPGSSPPLAEGVPTPSIHDNLCLIQVEREEALKCDEDGGGEGWKDKDTVQCNGVKEITDVSKDLCSLRLSDEPTPKETQATRQRLERNASRFEAQRKAGIAATKTLIPREHPTQDWSILSVLYQFTSPEFLSGNNMYICTVCNKRGNKNTKATTGSKMPVMTIASKQLLVFSPPAVLTLHLKRFQQVGFGLRKITRHVEFSELLDLAPYCSALCENVRIGQRRVLYSLFGIVEHSGTLRSGHYTSYVKVRHSNPSARQYLQTLSISQLSIDHLVMAMKAFATTTTCAEDHTTDCASESDGNVKEGIVPPGKWFYISDSNVSEVRNVSNVFSCQAYLLFYERIE